MLSYKHGFLIRVLSHLEEIGQRTHYLVLCHCLFFHGQRNFFVSSFLRGVPFIDPSLPMRHELLLFLIFLLRGGMLHRGNVRNLHTDADVSLNSYIYKLQLLHREILFVLLMI